MDLYAIDWELHEGPALRRHEAAQAAERARLVRELRDARRARRPRRASNRTSWWARHHLWRRQDRKELAVGR